MIPTKKSVEIPTGQMTGQITGAGVVTRQIDNNGKAKMAAWLEFRISNVADFVGRDLAEIVGDDEFELKVSYPLPFTERSLGGALLRRFGYTGPMAGEGIDEKGLFLGCFVDFHTMRRGFFVDVVRESLAPVAGELERRAGKTQVALSAGANGEIRG